MKKMILKAGILLIGCIVLIIINQVRKSKNGGKKQVIAKGSEVSQAFMMDTFEPIEDFEMVYFDENRGLVQIKHKGKP
ncbi:MAG: hypothetical protein RI965_1779 [Bacteroidota bacterium]|jgi:hypothetical protein